MSSEDYSISDPLSRADPPGVEPTSLWLVCAVLATATLSGVFGMGGGMLLMAVAGSMLPVGPAMVLHGGVQLVANGSRLLAHLRHVHWRTLALYAVGALPAAAGMASIAFSADRATMLLTLGALPLVASFVPRQWCPSVDRRSHAVACGGLMTVAQLTAGAAGPLLDLFFVRSRLDRHQVIATKAVTQTLSHAIKLAHYGAVVSAWDTTDLGPWTLPASAVAAVTGTLVGKRLLGRMTDDGFRRASVVLIRVVAAVLVLRGLAPLLSG